MFGIWGITPISITIFGCLKILCITISFWISLSKSSVNLGSNIFFIATGVPFNFPTWMVEKPPYPILSPISMSLIVISLTPGTEGNLPELTETFDEVWVKAWKFIFYISLLRLSIWSWSLFFSFRSFFNSSWTSFTLAF